MDYVSSTLTNRTILRRGGRVWFNASLLKSDRGFKNPRESESRSRLHFISLSGDGGSRRTQPVAPVGFHETNIRFVSVGSCPTLLTTLQRENLVRLGAIC